MIKPSLLITFFIFSTILSTKAQNEFFSEKRIVNPNNAAGKLRHPFAMVMGPDDSLWITERRGYVVKVSTVDGGKHQLLNIRSQVRFTVSGSNISQDGMLGIALHPELNKNTGNDFVYLAYCYDSSGNRRVRIVRYQYNRSVPSLSNPQILLNGIYGSNDHNGGRLIIGDYGIPGAPDYKLIYSVGDRGANQYSNSCDSIESQYTPTNAQFAAGNKRRYNGKILRINLDGSVPSNNPVMNGVQTHIYSMGHRNPQGLAFERDAQNQLIPGGRLYESEQGPASNDEVNIIESGKNYGWPRVAGKKDNLWYRYYKWNGTAQCSNYPGECSNTQTSQGLAENTFINPDYVDPIFDMFPMAPPGGSNCNWLTNPTLAPSSLAQYSYTLIPGWQNSLLITTLKSSAVYLLKMNAFGDGPMQVSDSIVELFKDENALNRYRDIAIGSDGLTFYMITDSVGATSGPSAGQNGGITNRGCILAYKYTGPLLSIDYPTLPPISEEKDIRFYPNPATNTLHVVSKSNAYKPLYFHMFDVLGKPVLNGNSRKEAFDINVSNLPRGVYVIQLYNGRKILLRTEKIIIQ